MKRRVLALFLALTMLIGMAPAVFAADTGFTDVAADAWYGEAVKWAVDNNITGGIGNGMFGPDQTCTRGQVVTFLWAAAGKPVMENADNPFADVSVSDWYYNAVMWAVSNNITGGTSATTFSPEAPCTRAAVVTFLYAAEGKPAVENANSDFVDVCGGDWFYAPVMWAVANDITGGIGNDKFGPDNACTRGQIALFLYKASLIGGSNEPVVTPEPEKDVVNNADDAVALLGEWESDYGYDNAMSELTEMHTTTIEGDSYYRLQQNYKGIPVYGRTVVCATDENGDVMSVTGNVADVDEAVDLTPSVTVEQVQSAVGAYFGEDSDTQIESFSADDLCVYNMGENEEARLAYCIEVGGYELLIDAKDAKVLMDVPTVFEETAIGYKASDTEREYGFNIDKVSEGNYVMRDLERGLEVYTFNRRSSGDGTGIDHTQANRVESTNAVFGDTEAEAGLEYEKAATLLQTGAFIYDYFADKRFDAVFDTVRLYYNDAFYNGKNALGGISNGTGVISMGWETGVDCVDVIGHEYTHYVSRELVHWIGGQENGALNEGFSDIFGEILETKFNSRNTNSIVDPDWEHGTRNILNPGENGYPTKISDKNNPNEDYSHGYSTVISHIAYLMWNGVGGTSSKKISVDELGELWYRTMLLLPADCNFNDCRNMVELAATSMNFTKAQHECISEAFNQAGITGKSADDDFVADYDISTNCELRVTSRDENYYGNYTLEIAKRKLFGGADEGFRRTISVAEAGPYALDLPKGNYVLTITDNAHPDRSRTFTVSVKNSGGTDTIIMVTNFGDTPVKGTVSEIKVIDGVETNVPIPNAMIQVHSEAANVVVETINMAECENGVFQIYLPMGVYSLYITAEGYVDMTLTFEVDEYDANWPIVMQPKAPAEPTKRLTAVDKTDDSGNGTRATLHYNESTGLLEKITVSSLQSGDVSDLVNYHYYYDNNGCLVKMETSGNGKKYKCLELEYNNENRIAGWSKQIVEGASDRMENYIAQVVCGYDQSGRMVERTVRYEDDLTTIEYQNHDEGTSDFTYTYDSQNRVKEVKETRETEGDNNHDTSYLNARYTYNEDSIKVIMTDDIGLSYVYNYKCGRAPLIAETVGPDGGVYTSWIYDFGLLQGLPFDVDFELTEFMCPQYISFTQYYLPDGPQFEYDDAGNLTKVLMDYTEGYFDDTIVRYNYDGEELDAPDTPDVPQIPNPPVEDIDHVQYEKREDDRSYYNGEGVMRVEYSFDKITITDEVSTAAAINDAIDADVEKFFTQITDSELKSYAQSPLLEGDDYFSCTALSEVTNNSNGIFSIRVETYWMMGGVGNTDYYGLNFDLNTGEPVNLAELFGMSEQELTRQLKDIAWAYVNRNYEDDLADYAYEALYGYTLEEFIYYFNDGELVLTFPTYTLGYGYAGAFTVLTGMYNE